MNAITYRNFNQLCKSALVIAVLLMSAPAQSQGEVTVRDFDGVKIYHVPYGQKIETTRIKLYTHYLPLRAEQGWTYALIDVGYKLTNPIMVEEIPGGADSLIGRKPFGERAYIALNGSGYTEIRKDSQTPAVRKIHWKKGDAFTAPFGYWVGHANPYDQPARLLTLGATLSNDLLDPDIAMAADRPQNPYVTTLLPFEQNDIDAGKVGADPSEFSAAETVNSIRWLQRNTFYQMDWGHRINLETAETSTHYFPKRAANGWRSTYIWLGGRILNLFIVQDIPPGSKEIGHKHGFEVIFLGLKGEGILSVRDQHDSPPNIIHWYSGDLFCLPWRPQGTWHAHSNPGEQPARILASVHTLEGEQLLNPYLGRIVKLYRLYSGQDSDHVYEDESPQH